MTEPPPRVGCVTDELFDVDDDRDDASDLFEQGGPGLFDEPEPSLPVPELVNASTNLSAPAATHPPREVMPVPDAPLALYRRYRPDTFDDLIGQEHVTAPLRRALENNRVNHAYLFSGPRGCGKTTSARILARCLNCEQGPSPTPCGQCQSCRDLARGGPGSIDVIEIDAASHGTVDDARDLRERAFFAPVSSRYKIYIVDEAHQVTPAGFNALLKLVEEPPPHVKFIFATTEPEKVIGTIRSRTHHYPFRLVPPKVLSAYLAHLCQEEGVAIEPSVLPLVVRAGAGSVRDSLSVLDQLLGGATEQGVTYAQATGLLGYTPDALLDEIMDAFGAGDGAAVFACIDKVMEVGQDPRRFAEDLLRRLRDLVIVAAVPDATHSGLVDVSPDQAERLAVQAQGLGLGELTRAAEVIAAGLTEMRGTTAPRLHLELMCARVLLPGADVDERGIHARLERLERRLSMVGEVRAPAPDAPRPGSVCPQPDLEPARSESAPVAAPARRNSDPASLAPAPPQAEDVSPVAAPSGRIRADEPTPRPASRPSGRIRADESAPAPAPRPEPMTSAAVPQLDHPAAVASSVTTLTAADVRALWPTILDKVMERRRFTWVMLSQNAQVSDFREGVLTLALANNGAREAWSRGGNDDVLADVLVEVLGVSARIEAIVDASAGTARTFSEPPHASAPTPQRTEATARAVQAARENIRETREGPRKQEPQPEDPEIDPDDPDADVGMPDSAELLTRELGAVRIEE